MKKRRIAFAGFRHSHILDLYEFARECDDLSIVAAAEDHELTASQVADKGAKLTHSETSELFDDADAYDIVAIGDYYGRRGELAIRALELGKHVISDKPICTSLDELDTIERISSQKGLSVGCMLNIREVGQYRATKKLIEDGVIGEVRTANFLGQHPLNYGTRAEWYFEEQKHGGTINDIAIHAVDMIPWLTGLQISKVVAARTWNARIPEHPHFQTCAQLMLELENRAGVLGDVSYLSPDSQGYTVPQYWRITIHGDDGIIEAGPLVPDVQVWKNGDDSVRIEKPSPDRPNGVTIDFLREIDGETRGLDLTTQEVISSSRVALKIQRAADTGDFPRNLYDS